MGLVFDAIVVIIAIIMIVTGYKRGLFKSIMTLISGIAALMLSYAFTPWLSDILNKKFFLNKLAGGITDTLASLSENGINTANEAMYDVSKLIGDSGFTSIAERYGSNNAASEKAISSISDSSHTAVEKAAEIVARPIATTVSDITAFIVIFVVSLVLLKVLTFLIDKIFKI